LCGGRLVLAQPREGYRFSLDSLLLAWWVEFAPAERVLDAGCGAGVVALALACCRGARSVVGVELQDELAAYARANVAAHGAGDRVEIRTGDLRALPAAFAARFDVVVANPPFRKVGTGRVNAAPGAAAARHELTLTLAELAGAAARAMAPGGRLYMIYPPGRLGEAAHELAAAGLGLERLRFVHPRAGAPANLVLAAARLGGAPAVATLPPLVVYGPGRGYGDEVAAIYAGDGRPLYEC